MMNKEMVFLIIPVCGFLSQLGGSDYAPKSFRRLGIPIVMGLAVWYFQGVSVNILLMMITQYGAYTLPFTLIGDGVPQNKLNWLWIWIWSILVSASALWVNASVWPAVLIIGAILAVFCTLSNIPQTAGYFPWKLCEMVLGAAPAVVLSFAVI
jgi:hypothetical protein